MKKGGNKSRGLGRERGREGGSKGVVGEGGNKRRGRKEGRARARGGRKR